jgi:hypothetical protein
MTKLKCIAWIGITAVAAALIVKTSISLLCAYQQRERASECLLIIQQIKVGSSAERDVQSALAAFRKYEKAEAQPSTGGDYHSYAYWFDNDSFRIPLVSSYQRFACVVMYHNGIVFDKSVGYIRRNPFTNRLTWIGSRETVLGFRQDSALDHSSNGVKVTRDSKVLIDIDTRAPAPMRKAAFDYNLGCLTSLFGCQNAEAILPDIKAIESAGAPGLTDAK